MLASGSRIMIAGSLSGCTAGFRRSYRSSLRSSGPRRSCVAQGRLSLLLALVVAPTGRATADRHGAARVDPADERRKPGRDLQEFLCANPLMAAKTRVHCIDQDGKALAYAGTLLKDFPDRVTFEKANVLKWRSEDKYDLVWSAGLFDYLSNALFTRVLRKLLLNCKKDGQVVIGNFSQRNVHRTYMEIGGWHLRHRSEAELLHLAKRAVVEESLNPDR